MAPPRINVCLRLAGCWRHFGTDLSNTRQFTATHYNPLQHTATQRWHMGHAEQWADGNHVQRAQFVHPARCCFWVASQGCVCVAVCCSALQCVAEDEHQRAQFVHPARCCFWLASPCVCCSVLQCVAVCCSVLQCGLLLLSGSPRLFVAVCLSLTQPPRERDTHCNTLRKRHTATHWERDTLQHTERERHCNTKPGGHTECTQPPTPSHIMLEETSGVQIAFLFPHIIMHTHTLCYVSFFFQHTHTHTLTYAHTRPVAHTTLCYAGKNSRLVDRIFFNALFLSHTQTHTHTHTHTHIYTNSRPHHSIDARRHCRRANRISFLNFLF